MGWCLLGSGATGCSGAGSFVRWSHLLVRLCRFPKLSGSRWSWVAFGDRWRSMLEGTGRREAATCVEERGSLLGMKAGDLDLSVGLYAPNRLIAQALTDLIGEVGVAHRPVEDPVVWAWSRPARLLLLGDPPFSVVADLVAAGRVRAVVVTDVQPVALQAEAGGFPVVPTTVEPWQMAVAIEAARSGMGIVHPDRASQGRNRTLDEDEWNLLIALVTYRNASRIGEVWFRSETTVRRRLRQLYGRIGADGREDALYLAGRYGVVADPTVEPPAGW